MDADHRARNVTRTDFAKVPVPFSIDDGRRRQALILEVS